MTITQAVKNLRRHLGDTQQTFANRLGVAMISVIRYESARRPPQGKALALMYRTAREAGNKDLAEIFWTALHRELGLSEHAGGKISDAHITAKAMEHRIDQLQKGLHNRTLTSDQRDELISKIAASAKSITAGLEALDPFWLVPEKAEEE
jgi:transcriptional regulator with XRE-family HTH domain